MRKAISRLYNYDSSLSYIHAYLIAKSQISSLYFQNSFLIGERQSKNIFYLQLFRLLFHSQESDTLCFCVFLGCLDWF